MKEYIEREAALLEIEEWADTFCECDYVWPHVIKSIRKFPAADVRPVVRGKWKVSLHKTYYDVSCSVCGINSFFQVDEKDSVSYANYCPNCGARMEKS